jgi:dTDP-glucose 4,6-dehydratase
VRSGLVDTIAWYEANEDWWRTAKVAAEARYERLGR